MHRISWQPYVLGALASESFPSVRRRPRRSAYPVGGTVLKEPH